MEVKNHSVDIVIVEPGPIDTNAGEVGFKQLEQVGEPRPTNGATTNTRLTQRSHVLAANIVVHRLAVQYNAPLFDPRYMKYL